jgi:hypothetical protein
MVKLGWEASFLSDRGANLHKLGQGARRNLLYNIAYLLLIPPIFTQWHRQQAPC